MKTKILVFTCLTFIFLNIISAQNEEAVTLKPLFLRATIYPTYSLARYDYNIDLNKIELRVYLELRDEKRTGAVINNAQVYINGNLIPFESKKKDYRKNINVSTLGLSNAIKLMIKLPDGRSIKQSWQFPVWLILKQPKPAIMDFNKDITIEWKYADYEFPVTLHVYDFKKGTQLVVSKNVRSGKLINIKSKNIPADTIIRIWVTADWFFKKYITGRGIVRGSEINVMPWSQTFVRIKPDRK